MFISILFSYFVLLHFLLKYRCTAVTKLNLSKNRNNLNRIERDTLQAFLARLHTDYLTATPLGLYYIRPSLFLTMTTLTFTYTLILFPKLINSNQW